MASRIHSYPFNASVLDEPFRATNSFFNLHKPTTIELRRSRRNNTPRNGSSDGRNERTKIGTSMARKMPHLRPQGTIQKKIILNFPPRGDKMSHQAKAIGETRSKGICSGNHSNTARNGTGDQPGDSTHGGTRVSPSPTNKKSMNFVIWNCRGSSHRNLGGNFVPYLIIINHPSCSSGNSPGRSSLH